MFRPDITKQRLLKIIRKMSALDVARFLYCQEMAGAYLAINKFEDQLIMAMHMCDRIRLKSILGDDANRWMQMLAKKEQLQSSTLGALVKILENHSLADEDLHYLKWIKNKRDHFVHRQFHSGAWPGDLDEASCRVMTRRLLALQLWLSRAERNIWSIFERAGFVEVDRLSDGGILAFNVGVYDFLAEPDEDT